MSNLNGGTKKPKHRYGMIYFTTGGFAQAPDRWGSTNNLERACGWCAFHISAGDQNPKEAKKAAIVDRFTGSLIKTYSRTTNGITIQDR